MIYQAEIRVLGDPDVIFKSFGPEIRKSSRSVFEVKKEKDCVKFEVKARDPTALRATLNSITKLLDVYEKVSLIQ